MNAMQTLHNQVMNLPERERARLAHDLIQSLHEASDGELNPEQEREIQRCLNSIHDGTASARPVDQVLAVAHCKRSPAYWQGRVPPECA
jgi:putative addiction module component (TIGR02574 family)